MRDQGYQGKVRSISKIIMLQHGTRKEIDMEKHGGLKAMIRDPKVA